MDTNNTEAVQQDPKNKTVGKEDHPLPEDMVDDAPELSVEEAEKRIRRMSRRSFVWAGMAIAGGFVGLRTFNRVGLSESGLDEGVHKTLRGVLRFNDKVAQGVFYAPTHLSPTFPRSQAEEPRNNYKGETPIVDLEAWRLKVLNTQTGKPLKIALADLKDLPFVEQTTELHCVEGWSKIVNWGGYRFVDFAKKYPFAPGTKFVSMLSEPADYPDERYYVGLDIASCLHPQTLLATHMNGQELTAEHGAPLRLIMPHKYGIKNIKLITTIAYTNKAPADYWAEQGYDYYAGL